jgi:Cys-rich repeat protein
MPEDLMSRTALSLAFCCLVAAGCNRDDSVGYCDDSGCFACSDSSRQNCWPLQHDPCSAATDCAGNQVCTNVGCCARCGADSDCKTGEACTNGYCAPKNTQTQPVSATPNNNTVLCRADVTCPAGQECSAGICKAAHAPACGIQSVLCAVNADCGANRACQGGGCHATCSASVACPLGQSCTSGVCLDASPATAQCLWDFDCGPASRCINASCHPLCGADAQCASGELCDSGVCRADYRPAH